MPAVGFNFRKIAATARLSAADFTLEFDIFKNFKETTLHFIFILLV